MTNIPGRSHDAHEPDSKRASALWLHEVCLVPFSSFTGEATHTASQWSYAWAGCVVTYDRYARMKHTCALRIENCCICLLVTCNLRCCCCPTLSSTTTTTYLHRNITFLLLGSKSGVSIPIHIDVHLPLLLFSERTTRP